MQYLFSKAWKRFHANRKRYLLFILQISIGVCMVALSLNINLTFQTEFSEFKRKTDNLYINLSAGEIYGNSPDALSVENYRNVQTAFYSQKDRIAYYQKYYAEGIPILFVDENFCPLIMKTTNHKKDSVYIGSKARQYYDDLKVQGVVSDSFIDTQKERIFDIPISAMISLGELDYQSRCLLEDGALTDINGEVDFEDYIIFPIAIYERLNVQPDCIRNLAVIVDSEGNAEKLAGNILANLMQQNETETYMVMNYAAFAEEMMNRNVHVAQLLNFLSAFVLVIVIFGLMGLLFILINQRSKEFAISLMCGASRWQIILEIWMEILLVVMIGVGIGTLVGALCAPLLGNRAPTFICQMQTLSLTLLGGIAISSLICLPFLHRLKHIAPTKLLKNL